MAFPLLSIFFLMCCNSLSLVKMGILEASSDLERYKILYETHVKAIEKDVVVDYTGVDTLRLSIPYQAKSVPLGRVTDFKGTVFIVNNESIGNFFLFALSKTADTITINERSFLDNGKFQSMNELRSGYKMMIIEDRNLWIDNRRGFNYGMKRRDILLLKNGKALNRTCAPYNNEYSAPICTVVPISSKRKTFSNITFYRTEKSKNKTFLAKFENEYNIYIKNVNIFTPKGTGLYGDMSILIKDCARVTMDNIVIDGTYSMDNKYGYGISLDNVYDIDFNHIEGKASWGVFGNNNVNYSVLRNSHINRYDVHCYGRDIYFENCLFDTSGFLYSSIFGQVNFKNCVFNHVFPCLNRLDFNAYTPFDIKFTDCTFHFDGRHYAMVNLSDVDDILNHRYELLTKSLPNIEIKNSTIFLENDVRFMYFYYVGGCKYPYPINHLSRIKMKNVTFKGLDVKMGLFNTYVETESVVETTFENINYQSASNIIPHHQFVSIKMLNHNDANKIFIVGEEFTK